MSNSVLAVTGGASGLGLATAHQWLAEGGRAVLLDLSQAALDQAVAELGTAARGIVTDVTDRASVDAALVDIRQSEGRLDALVNSAGNARPVATADMTDEDWDALVEVHLSGTMRCCRAAFPLLADNGGAIVNLSSIAGRTGMPQRASYNSVKSGLEGLTRSLAVEWAAHGIRVNAVGPGYVWTPFNAGLHEQGLLDPAPIVSRIPLKRMAEPAEIAEAIHFLASPRSSYITGHTLMADGGMSVEGNWYDWPEDMPGQ